MHRFDGTETSGRFGNSTHRRTALSHALILGGLLFLGGCGGKSDSEASKSEAKATFSAPVTRELTNEVSPGMDASPLESTNVMRAFQARGVIREIPEDKQTVLVRHEAIPGFMPKMTMSFTVRDTNDLRGLKPGDAISFKVIATAEDSWIDHIRIGSTNDLAPLPPSDPGAAALLQIAQMKTGDVLPDAELLAEDGRVIRLSEFQGRALAFTFIFTRCPLPDYCPRMNQHFGRARELLTQRSGGPTNWQFLSISFDPDFDKPGVLNRYAYSYRGSSVDRWLFASAPSNVMSSFVAQLDFRFANESGSFLHNLRTVVLDPQRRIHRQFDGNKWKASELADAIAEAAAKR